MKQLSKLFIIISMLITFVVPVGAVDTTTLFAYTNDKTEFDEYFKDLSEDINTLDDINTLPTTTVNKVGVAIAVSIIGGSSLFVLAGLFFKKYWLF